MPRKTSSSPPTLTRNLELSGSGSSNIILNPSGTGNIQLQGPVQITGGDNFSTSNSTPILFNDGIEPGNLELTGNTIQAINTNGGISITPAGSGGTYFTNGNVGIGTTNPLSKLEVEGAVAALNFSATSTTATSTFADGISLAGGCFALNGTCIGSSSASSTLLSDNNIFSGVDSFTNASSNFGGTWQTFAPTHFQPAGTYLTGLGNYATTTATAISISTSTLSWNGLTFGNTFAISGSGITVTPTVAGTISNAGLTNSTISGVSLGGNLANLSATNGTLTFSGSYNGSSAQTVGLNLGNSDWWTATQNFTNASTSEFTATSSVWFTSLGTPAGAFLAVNPQGLLISTTTPSISLSGTQGQVAYFSGTNVAAGTSTLAISAAGNIGIGTSTPWAQLSVFAGGTYGSLAPSTLFAIGSSTAGTATSTLLSFTSNGQFTVGPNISPVSTSTQLSVLSGSTTLNNISSNTLNANGYGIYVQGRYAYLADNGTTNAFEIWDVSNPASPVRVSSNTLNATGENIYVQGRYAYIVGGSTNGFEVWDVSNPASPVRVSSNTLNAIGEGIYVQGRYAFITDAGGTNAFEVWDVSNPASPVRVSSNTLNASAYDISVQGRYAYIVDATATNGFEVWDVSNPASPVRVSQSTLSGFDNDIYVQGRYAYIVGGSTNGFEVWDVSNPASPVRVSSNTLNANAYGISVQGRYAYITENSITNAFEVWTSPTLLLRCASRRIRSTMACTFISRAATPTLPTLALLTPSKCGTLAAPIFSSSKRAASKLAHYPSATISPPWTASSPAVLVSDNHSVSRVLPRFSPRLPLSIRRPTSSTSRLPVQRVPS